MQQKSLYLFSGRIALLCALINPQTHALEFTDNTESLAQADSDEYRFGIDIGALNLIGSDFRIHYQPPGTNLLIGYRYLDIEDDFLNLALLGLPDDDSDKEFTERSGPYVSFLFDPTAAETFYLVGAFYKVEQRVVCFGEEDSDSATSLYFGGGYRKKLNPFIGYNVGIEMSGANLSIDTGDCSSESDGDIDMNVSLFISF